MARHAIDLTLESDDDEAHPSNPTKPNPTKANHTFPSQRHDHNVYGAPSQPTLHNHAGAGPPSWSYGPPVYTEMSPYRHAMVGINSPPEKRRKTSDIGSTQGLGIDFDGFAAYKAGDSRAHAGPSFRQLTGANDAPRSQPTKDGYPAQALDSATAANGTNRLFHGDAATNQPSHIGHMDGGYANGANAHTMPHSKDPKPWASHSYKFHQQEALRTMPHPSPGETSQHSGYDSVISGHINHALSSLDYEAPAIPSTLTSSDNVQPQFHRGRKPMQPFSAEDDRLIIYLKEVLQLRWKDFERYFPGRKWTNVQVRYSQKLNKRDRTQDPPEYSLPPAILSAMDHQTPRPLSHPVLPHGPSPALFTSAHILEQDSLSERDSPSGNEYPVRRNRPRRDVPTHDYTWPGRHRSSRAETEVEDETVEATDADTPVSSDPSVESVLIPEKAIPVENPPLDMELEQSDARLALSGVPTREGPEGRLPYLSCSQRSALQKRSSGWELDQLVSREWQGAVLHVDLSPAEMDIAESVISKVLGQPQLSDKLSRRRRFRMMLKDVPEPKLLKLGYELRYQLMGTRDTESIKAFLYDARKGKLRSAPMVERMGAARPKLDYSSTPKTSTASMVLQRELGLQSRRGWKSATHPVTYQLRNRLIDTLGPAHRYTGASSDVHTVAWSPDGQCFAAGAVCVTDAHSMQYNRPNNLLYGNVAYNTIHELREHYVERPKMESGPNSTQAMFESQDRKLYTTISSVAFSPNGKYMFSAGYDNHAVIWEAPRDGTQPRLVKALKHKAEVDMLAVSCAGKVATAAKKSSRHGSANAVKVISIGEDNPEDIERVSFTSQKAGERPDLNILPTALQFEPNHGRLLLAGFGANNREDRFDTNGDICLWDLHSQEQLYVHGSGRNVFDVAWNGDQRGRPWFAVGCVAGGNVNRGTRSVLRLYDGYGLGKYSMAMEIECKALDMNDVLFCPHDENLIAAGCTSGRAYVWDLRWPDTWLRELAHSSSLMPLDDYTDREITDTGVRFLSWGDNASRLYSGSSDGVVKVWDVIGPEEETFVKDLATLDSGIMAGAFSPDYSKLVIGEVDGSVNVLEVGRDDSYDAEKLKYIPYVEGPDEDAMEIPTTGVAIASDLVASGEMMRVPFGGYPVRQAVQGPNYNGPYDNAIDAPFLREQALEMQLHLSKSPAPQCDIWACNDTVKVTSEEVGDSGRSEDRIPDELRKQWKLGGASSIPPGKSRCANCGRAARPMNSQEVDAAPLCERCSFACFRCGANNNVDPKTETLNCHHCQRVWSIGAVGFDCVRETLDPTNFSDVPSLRRYAKEVSRTKLGEDNASFGDEMNALTDYFHSLATDRPNSPPL